MRPAPRRQTGARMTVSIQIVYWRDIPAQVKGRAGRERAGRQLSERFQEAIDQAAMRAGVVGSDAYLQEWRTTEAEDRAGELRAVLDSVAAELEAAYPEARLRALAENKGQA